MYDTGENVITIRSTDFRRITHKQTSHAEQTINLILFDPADKEAAYSTILSKLLRFELLTHFLKYFKGSLSILPIQINEVNCNSNLSSYMRAINTQRIIFCRLDVCGLE